MAEIDALNVTVKANADSFLAAMQMVEQNTARAAAALDGMSASSRSADQSHQASASAIGFATAAWQAGIQAVEQLADKLADLGAASVEAATQMDPSAALAWDSATDHMGDGILALKSRIGEALLPTLEKFSIKVGDVASKLSHMDWAGYAKQAEPFFDSILSTAQDWGGKLLDFLTWPFRMMVGQVEKQLADVMASIGKVLTAVGGTSIGKKMGLDDFSGDALAQTAADMQKQAANIEKSFSGAWQEVANGARYTVGAALDAINAKTNGLVDRMKSDFANASTDPGKTRQADDLAAQRQSMANRLAFENQIAQMKDQQNQADISMQRMVARERKAELMSEAQQQEQNLQQLMQRLSQDRSSGNLGELASDQAAVAAALASTQQAYSAAVAESQKALEGAKKTADQLTAAYDKQLEVARKAMEAANAAHEAAVSGGNNEQLKDTEVRASAAYQKEQAHLAQLNSQKIAAAAAVVGIETQAQNEIRADKLRTAHDVAAIEDEASKARMEFYKSTMAGLSHSALGGLGSSMLSAGEQGAAAAGPMGAAVGVGASLLQNSAGLKKLGDAISGVLQQVADAVGKLFEPLLPVIKQISAALSPVINALGTVFTALGRSLAAALEPLMPVIELVANLLTEILTPISEIIDAVRPLIPIIIDMAEIIFAVANIGFAPMLIALKALGPVLEEVGKVIKYVVEGIGEVWNGILHVLEGVFDALAHALPAGAGDAMRDVYNGLVSMEVPIDALQSSTSAAADAASRAAVALNMLSSESLDMASAMHTVRNQNATEAQRDVAQTEVNAYYGTGVQNVAGIDFNFFNEALAKVMTDGGQAFVDAVTQAQSTATSDSNSAQQAYQKVQLDKSQSDALIHAMSQTTDPAVKAQLQKQYDQLQQQYQLDIDAWNVAQDQANIAADQLKVAEDQLQLTIELAEYQKAMSDGNQTAANQLADAIWGQVGMFGSITDQNAGTAGLAGQIYSDNHKVSSDQQSLSSDLATQALDQAKATVANSAATSANTKATQDLSQQLTNMVSGFNVNDALYQIVNSGGGGGSSPAPSSGAYSLKGGAALDQSGLLEVVKATLKSGAAHNSGGITVNGDIKIEVDSKSPNDFADRVEDALRKKTFRKHGVSVAATAGDF